MRLEVGSACGSVGEHGVEAAALALEGGDLPVDTGDGVREGRPLLVVRAGAELDVVPVPRLLILEQLADLGEGSRSRSSVS